MKNKLITFMAFAILSLLFHKCSCIYIRPPKVNLTGNKTAIERQIVGDYKELEKDAWMISSIRTPIEKDQKAAMIQGGDRYLYRAMKVREFHLDKIRIYKDEGALGETNNGYIVYRPAEKYERNKGDKNILFTVVKEENKARKAIFSRSIIRHKSKKIKIPEKEVIMATEEEMEEFGRRFASDQIEAAKKNDWIQTKAGAGIRKK